MTLTQTAGKKIDEVPVTTTGIRPMRYESGAGKLLRFHDSAS
ncbi:MAG TPA: hypothetical protein PKV75_03825 [Desulfobacterales bacterium]|nr:hypothetical protein [Desulfobacterales bacterium]